MDPEFDVFGRVVIGDYAYLGNNTLVMPGVTIGNNVLVAARSVVTKSIPDNVVVAGSPVKYICTIDEYYRRNIQYNTRTNGMSPEEKKKFLLKAESGFFIKKQNIHIER